MSSFTTRLVTTELEDPHGHPMLRRGRVLHLVLEPFRYEVGFLGSGDVIEVPVGFITDFASVPRALWAFEPPIGRIAKAAVLHDFLYAGQLRPRIECDRIFYEAMGVLGVPDLKRSIIYAGVRAGGGKGYSA